MTSQREAVFTAVTSVVGEIHGGAVSLSDKQKEQVHALVFAAFKTGTVELKGTRTDEWLRKYIPGLVNNWVRKDRNLNGDMKYTAKHPGIRAGSGDEQMKAMKALLSSTTDPAARSQIEAEISRRKAELKPAVVINAAALPASLRHLVPTAS